MEIILVIKTLEAEGVSDFGIRPEFRFDSTTDTVGDLGKF